MWWLYFHCVLETAWNIFIVDYLNKFIDFCKFRLRFTTLCYCVKDFRTWACQHSGTNYIPLVSSDPFSLVLALILIICICNVKRAARWHCFMAHLSWEVFSVSVAMGGFTLHHTIFISKIPPHECQDQGFRLHCIVSGLQVDLCMTHFMQVL